MVQSSVCLETPNYAPSHEPCQYRQNKHTGWNDHTWLNGWIEWGWRLRDHGGVFNLNPESQGYRLRKGRSCLQDHFHDLWS